MPGEVVESPFLEIFKTYLDTFLLQGSCFSGEWERELDWTILKGPMLLFCYSDSM